MDNQVSVNQAVELVSATVELLDAHVGAAFIMLEDYFKRSHDHTSNPEATFKSIRWRLTGDDKFYLMFVMLYGTPVGFLAGDLVQNVARILIGYLPPRLEKDRERIIDMAIGGFEKWACVREATEMMFYTYRSPNAHHNMVKRGFRHDLTIYKKELPHG